MPHICPTSCSGLAVAAVFLSIGVVQFVVGIILLRSKYVFLLAGPDFWTSCSNIAVGCLLGISASVWKESKKHPSSKHFIRRNLLLALQLSALVINATTLAILLLGEGNTLLSIRLESGVEMESTSYFVNEVLAYAYATSVCAPIICIVVSIVAMSGNIFQAIPKIGHKGMTTPDTILKKNRTQSFQWVYTPEMLALAKKKIREAILSASSISDSSSDETHDDTPPRKKYGNYVKESGYFQNSMDQEKRKSVPNGSIPMLHQMDRRRKLRYSQIRDGSYVGPSISWSKEPGFSDRRYRTNLTNSNKSSLSKNNRNSLDGNGNSSHTSSGYMSLERKRHQNPDPIAKSPYIDEVFDENHNTAPAEQITKNLATRYRKHRKNCKLAEFVYDLENEEIVPQTIAAVHKSPRVTYLVDNPDELLLELKKQCNAYVENRKVMYNKGSFSAETPKDKASGSSQTDCFSPEESDFADSFDFNRTGSWAGEFVPISINSSAATRVSNKLIPVQTPVVPNSEEVHCKTSYEETSNSCTRDDAREISGNNKKNLASFQENGVKYRNGDCLEYPKPGSSQCLKKYDLTKMATMSSISEEPAAETLNKTCKITPNQEISSSSFASVSNKKSLASAYSESSKTYYQTSTSSAIGREKTPLTKTGASCKTIRRIWSSIGSEKEIDIIDQVVDEDSLIGLSEEELIARQTRTRSIRQAVEQRIKGREVAA